MPKRRQLSPETVRLRQEAVLAKSDRDVVFETFQVEGDLLKSFILAYGGVVEAAYPLTGDTGGSVSSTFEWSEPGAAVRKQSGRARYFRRRVVSLRDEMLGAPSKRVRGLWCATCSRFGHVSDRYCATCGLQLGEKE